ncbi:family 16 glycoside hydrolase [Streptosporangium sp. DT93]|uniref:pectate lyase family protein n=1 Tax=Streptosporangium sp. DT93 TaxID=3393428 RepID=UPI003CF6B813
MRRRKEPRTGSLLVAIMMTVMAAVLGALALPALPSAFAATLFTDNFEDGDSAGWTKSGGSWSVTTDGSRVYRQSGTGADSRAIAGTGWSNQAVQARVRPITFNGAGRYAAVLARAQSTGNYYYLGLSNAGSVVLGKRAGGGSTVLDTAPATVTAGTWYTVRLEAFGSTLRGFVNNVEVVSATDSTFASGKAGLAGYYTSASFDDVQVTDVAGPSEPTPTVTPTVTPTITPPPGSCNTSGSPVGFASVDAWGQNGTTGGAGGPTVEVDTAGELISAIGQSGPLNVCVRGMVTVPAGMYNVSSDKTIVGIGADAGISGGGLNVGLPLDNSATSPPANAVNNVIIRNLSFRNANDDSINVQMFSHHVWIDHNDLADGYDGLLDIKRGSSYITVSWNHAHDHSKNMLLGHDDSNGAQDVGRLKVTYHHNWFDATPQRNPRVRFGEPVHIFNNYYYYNTDVGVACQANAGCLIEGNYFERVEYPASNSYAGPSGRCVARNNVLVDSGEPECSGSVQEASSYYGYTLENPNSVKASVTAGAGVGKIGG